MGYEEHPQSSSSGVLIALVVVILFVAAIGIVAVRDNGTSSAVSSGES